VRGSANGVWVGNTLEYAVREYGLDGVLRRVIAREHPQLFPYFVYKGTGLLMGQFEPPLWLGDDVGLIARWWLVGIDSIEEFQTLWDQYLAAGSPPDTPWASESAIDLIDREGRVLGSLPMDGAFYQSIGTLQAIGPEGRLYTRVDDPYPQVRRYRVELHR